MKLKFSYDLIKYNTKESLLLFFQTRCTIKNFIKKDKLLSATMNSSCLWNQMWNSFTQNMKAWQRNILFLNNFILMAFVNDNVEVSSFQKPSDANSTELSELHYGYFAEKFEVLLF